MTDAELRGKLLKHFYDLRDKNGGWVPVTEIIVAPHLVTREAIANACQHLADAGLVQWELFTPVLKQYALGKAKITGSGIDVATGSRTSALDIRFPEAESLAAPITTAVVKEPERINLREGFAVDLDEKIALLTRFRDGLTAHHKSGGAALREWLNGNVVWVRKEIVEAKCFHTLTITPPPITGGPIFQSIDPFNYMFDPPYGRSVVPNICDMIDKTIGLLRNPVEAAQTVPSPSDGIELGTAFIAMPIDENDHQLIDVLEAIKESASKCGITADRVDEVESNDRITDRILEYIRKAEFVIVDLTNERPNVFFEAGFAQGIGKIPIYLARHGTKIHFDLKDYPIIQFRSMKELKEKLAKRLNALIKERIMS
jgi:hypothetical protein